MLPISIIVLLAVFFLVAVRNIRGIRLQIWQIMLGGALIVLATGQIGPADALRSINPDVMLFLFGMFVVGHALEESGYLAHLSYKFFRRARSMDALVLMILFVIGIASAFLMNDTLAIIGTPVVLLLARKHNMNARILLLALAFAVTIGSVMSPIGNPQNLLIAINGGIETPFVTFGLFLLVPTFINLFLAYIILRLFYRKSFKTGPLDHSQEPIRDKRLAALSKISVLLVVALVFAKIAVVTLGLNLDFRLTYIALFAAAPILLLSPRRLDVLKRIDWHTLIFFAAMFVLMESVWDSGFFQSVINGSGANITSIGMILSVSVVLSQFISNVPLVALYLPMLLHAGAGTPEMIALAAGSTIAGNLTILGAASNVIIIQNMEKRSKETIGFLEFAKAGVPLTIINVLVYWWFFMFFG